MLFEGLQGEDVGIGEVLDVDVVSDAGAIRGGIVLAEDLDAGAEAEGDVKQERNEVGFGLMVFSVAGNGSGDVEVAEGGVAKAVNLIHPAHHVLREELGLAVGVGGGELGVFKDRGSTRARRSRRRWS